MEKTPLTFNEVNTIATSLLPKDDYYVSYNAGMLDQTYIITHFGTIFLIGENNPFGDNNFITGNNQNVRVIRIKGIDKILELKGSMPFDWLVNLYIEEYE
jgi:hypothetical protein